MSINPYSYPEIEEYPKKQLTITNNLPFNIAIGQMASDWNTVNFIINHREFDKKNIKWLATLSPGDKLSLDFKEPEKIKR